MQDTFTSGGAVHSHTVYSGRTSKALPSRWRNQGVKRPGGGRQNDISSSFHGLSPAVPSSCAEHSDRKFVPAARLSHDSDRAAIRVVPGPRTHCYPPQPARLQRMASDRRQLRGNSPFPLPGRSHHDSHRRHATAATHPTGATYVNVALASAVSFVEAASASRVGRAEGNGPFHPEKKL